MRCPPPPFGSNTSVIFPVIVALARRLAVAMHRIRLDGPEFRWSRGGVIFGAA